MRRHAASIFATLILCACGPAQPTGQQDAGADAALSDAGQNDASTAHLYTDDDGDGYSEMQGDCDDTDPTVVPFGIEICGDGKDNNCNGATDENEPDQDGDGVGPCQGDCNDADPLIGPFQPEIPGDGIDNNCDGVIDADLDGDGWTEVEGDCNDADPAIYPGAAENCYDGIDNNCDFAIDEQQPDSDGDGFGPCQGDCDDTDPAVGPHLNEIPGDGIDNNCDNLVDEDIDGDGWTVLNGDCDDLNPAVNPTVLENCTDGIDNNCDGLIDQNCLSACDVAELTQSYFGCQFYAVDLPQISLDKMFGIIVSNPSDTETANVTITTAGGVVATWAIPPNSLQTYQDGTRALNVPTAGTYNRAYRIDSDLPVAAYQFNSIDTIGAASTDASLLFARHSLAKRYYAMDYTGFTGNSSFVAVVATEANTAVSMFPSTAATGATTGTLNPFDVMVIMGQNAGTSLTGTQVEADKPVAVFGGNHCTQVPYGTSYCDHIEEQIFPRQAIGSYYIVGKTHARTYCDPPDYLRILADGDNTTITLDPPVAGPWTLNAGQWIETTIDDSVEIHATGPVLVGQFLRSSGGGACQDEGDPAMMLQVPVAQFRRDYVFLTPSTYDTDYVDILAPLGSTVWLDGAQVALSNTTIGQSGYTLTSLVLADGAHVIDSADPIGIMVYGYGGPGNIHPSTQNVSYGYVGGLNLTAINPVE